MEYMALFFTHSGAIKYDRFLKANSIRVQLMPVPRKLSSNCGVGARFFCDSDVSAIVSEDIEKLYKVEGTNYRLIYSCN
jgi:hypothetical protein